MSAARPDTCTRLEVLTIFADCGGGARRVPDDHPTLEVDDAVQVAAYLNLGAVCVADDTLGVDVLAPGGGPCVPMSWRTDGRWVWPSGLSFYVARYRLAPLPAEFVDWVQDKTLPNVWLPPGRLESAAALALGGGR